MSKSAIGRVYGWRPDLPSQKPWFDHEQLTMRAGPTPDVMDMKAYIKWWYDQGQIGSCCTNSGIGAERLFRATHGLPDFLGARMFLYAAVRIREGTLGSDAGATIADTVATEQEVGVCLENLWPYSRPFNVKPSQAAYQNAATHKILVKQPVQQSQAAIEACLASKQPVHYGMTVYSSFESATTAKTGKVPMPKRGDQALGGHALYLYGYDRKRQVFLGINSWGQGWGLYGICAFEIPYAYILNPDLASDFWTILGMMKVQRKAA